MSDFSESEEFRNENAENSQRPSKTFYTSDTHFGSQRTLELSKRPYSTTTEMDCDLILRWNEKVQERDIVYHLGDFGDYARIQQLRGKVTLICGNYEAGDIAKLEMISGTVNAFSEFRENLISLGFQDVIRKETELKIGKFSVHATHCPHDCSKARFNIFGHIHKLCLVKRYGLNVGVDIHDFAPIDVDTVLFYKNAIEDFYDSDVFE